MTVATTVAPLRSCLSPPADSIAIIALVLFLAAQFCSVAAVCSPCGAAGAADPDLQAPSSSAAQEQEQQQQQQL
jgi:hypothetical protein